MASGRADQNMSEETFEYLCTPCADENAIKEGIKYCVECKGYCCKDCVSNHNKYPTLREHSLLEITILQHGDQASKLPSFPTEKCGIHQGKVIDMFCGDHGVVGCYACIAIDHKQCTDIHSIPDDIDDIFKETGFEKTCEDFRTMTESLRSTLQNSNVTHRQNIERAKEGALLAISKQRQKIDAILDQLEKNAKGEVESLYKQMQTDLKNIHERIEACLKKSEELGKKIQRAEGNKPQRFVCWKLASSNITKERVDSNYELAPFTGDDVMYFDAEKSLLEFLQGIYKFGQVKVGNKSTAQPYRIMQCRDINVRLPSDKFTCKIRGCCNIDEDKLFIADHANNNLKRVDIVRGTIVDHINLPSRVSGVCRVKNDELAVACDDAKLIQFVTIAQTMTLSLQIKLKHACYLVDCMDNKLYVSDLDSSVYIYDMVGTLLQTVSKDCSGKNLFTLSAQIALSDREDYMFVGGCHGLVCLDKTGNHIATIENPKIDRTRGVCIDGRGNVFVAGENSNNIVQFRYDGTKVGEIVNAKNGIQKPMTLYFHQKLRKLFVNMLENDKIKMFDLEQ